MPFNHRYNRLVFLLFPGAIWHAHLAAQTNDEPLQSKIKFRESTPRFQPASAANTVTWPWQFEGPSQMPAEPATGHGSIPSSALHRGNGIGRINWMSQHPARHDWIYACSPTGGLWISHNGGKSWASGGTDQLPVSGAAAIALNPKRSNEWIVATGDGDDVFSHSIGLYLTTNGGREYQSINGNDPATALPVSQGDQTVQIGDVLREQQFPDRVLVAASHGLWVCDDIQSQQFRMPGRRKRMRDPQLPLRWRRVDEGIYYDLEQVGDFLCASGDSLAISADHGQSWQRYFPPVEYNGQFPFVRMSLRSCASLPHFVFVLFTEGSAFTGGKTGRSLLYLFDLRSHAWQSIAALDAYSDGVAYSRARAWNVNPRNPQEILIANVHPIHISRDGGATFLQGKSNQMHDDVHGLLYSSDGKVIWAAHDGGVSVSFDGGVNWQDRSEGIAAANVFGLACGGFQDEVIAYGGYDTGGNVRRDGRWQHTSWGDGFETVVFKNGRAITSSQHGQLHASDSSGIVSTLNTLNFGAEWHTWLVKQSGIPDMLLTCGKHILRSFDEGSTWQTVFRPQEWDSQADVVYRVFVSEDQPDIIYAYVLQKQDPVHPVLWRTFNARESDPAKLRWERLPALPVEAWIAAVVIDGQNPEQCWVLLNHRRSTEKLWQWDGKNYLDVTSNLGGATCESMLLYRGQLFIGSNVGVFSRGSHEEQWELLKGLPGVAIKSMCVQKSKRRLLVGTFGRGIWSAPIYYDVLIDE